MFVLVFGVFVSLPGVFVLVFYVLACLLVLLALLWVEDVSKRLDISIVTPLLKKFQQKCQTCGTGDLKNIFCALWCPVRMCSSWKTSVVNPRFGEDILLNDFNTSGRHFQW